MRNYYKTNSHYLTYTSSLKNVGRMYFLSLVVKGLIGLRRCDFLSLDHTVHWTIALAFIPSLKKVAESPTWEVMWQGRCSWQQAAPHLDCALLFSAFWSPRKWRRLGHDCWCSSVQHPVHCHLAICGIVLGHVLELKQWLLTTRKSIGMKHCSCCHAHSVFNIDSCALR